MKAPREPKPPLSIPAEVRKRRVIAIVGMGETTREQLPRRGAEVWACNESYLFLPKRADGSIADRWFEIHPYHWLLKGSLRNIDHIGWLAQCGMPVYMQKHYEAIPTSVAYPLEQFRAAFDCNPTSAIAYMMGLAIMEGCDEIQLHGVEMLMDSEYATQRPCLRELRGFARARGIRVVVSPGCEIFDEPPYPEFLATGLDEDLDRAAIEKARDEAWAALPGRRITMRPEDQMRFKLLKHYIIAASHALAPGMRILEHYRRAFTNEGREMVDRYGLLEEIKKDRHQIGIRVDEGEIWVNPPERHMKEAIDAGHVALGEVA